jgi:hypothetical protein
MGKLANAAGAACCQVLGGLPCKDSMNLILKLRGGGGERRRSSFSNENNKLSFPHKTMIRNIRGGALSMNNNDNDVQGVGGGGAVRMNEFVQSLAMDASTLRHIFNAYTSTISSDGDNGDMDSDGDIDIENNPLLHEAAEMVKVIAHCKGRIHITGIGKSGIVARRFASSLASTGSPAHFTHASEWVHGDLGNAVLDTGILINK